MTVFLKASSGILVLSNTEVLSSPNRLVCFMLTAWLIRKAPTSNVWQVNIDPVKPIEASHTNFCCYLFGNDVRFVEHFLYQLRQRANSFIPKLLSISARLGFIER